MSRPIAILTGDWHVWGRAPSYRSLEQDWLGVYARAFDKMKAIQRRFGNIPVLLAGDVFDYYNPPPEIINWLISNMPKNVCAVPGQHDLQNHSLELIRKTGYWTLVEAGAIWHVGNVNTVYSIVSGKMVLEGAGWNAIAEPPQFPRVEGEARIFMAHRYVYSSSANSYQGVDESRNISHLEGFLKTCDVAVFGDNHVPFTARAGDCLVVNCGTLLCRKADENIRDAGFYVLMDDFSVKRVWTGDDKDVFSSREGSVLSPKIDMGFMEELQNGNALDMDFEAEVGKELDRLHASPEAIKTNDEIIRNANNDGH